MKLLSMGNSDAPPSSNLSCSNKITEVLEELILAAIGGQTTPEITQGHNEVYSAEHSPSVSRDLTLAFVTNMGWHWRAPGRQCSFLHVSPYFLEP